VKQQKEKDRSVLIVDAGDLFFEKETIPENIRSAAKLKAEFVVEAYNRIGCDALNVGERDLVLGLPFLKELEKRAKFPFVSANLTGKDNALLFKPYLIKRVGQVNVGIFGIMGDTAQIAALVKKHSGGAVLIQDAVEAAANVIRELHGKTDLIVALTHQNVGRDWVVARRVRGIDVIIGGHDKQKVLEPHIADNTRIVQAGEKGQYLGQMEVSVQLDGTKSYHNRLIPLGKGVADDESIKSMLKDYYRKVAALHGAMEQGPEVSLRAASCESCHKREFMHWKASRHAAAYASLVKRERQFDPDCLPCHTTRFEEPQGFSIQSHPRDLIGVQCESCHGLIAEHAGDAKKVSATADCCVKGSALKPARQDCLKCHTAERSPSFEKDYPVYLKKVKH